LGFSQQQPNGICTPFRSARSNLANLFRVKKDDGPDWTGFQWTRLSRQFALPKTFLKDSVWVYAECRKNLVCVVRESLGTTEKESG
jgi:hypothetical protein